MCVVRWIDRDRGHGEVYVHRQESGLQATVPLPVGSGTSASSHAQAQFSYPGLFAPDTAKQLGLGLGSEWGEVEGQEKGIDGQTGFSERRRMLERPTQLQPRALALRG